MTFLHNRFNEQGLSGQPVGRLVPDGRMIGRLPLGVYPMEEQGAMEMHAHSFWELVVVTRGSGVHVTEEEWYEIAAGDVFVITPSGAHGYRNTTRLGLENILFEPDRVFPDQSWLLQVPGFQALFYLEPKLRSQDRFSARLRLGPDQLRTAVALVSTLTNDLQSGTPLDASGDFFKLVSFLCRAYEEASSDATRHVAQAAEILAEIERSLEFPVSMDELASQFNMSRSTFFRRFRQITGTSPVQYLLDRRIARASELLRTTTLGIGEIAQRVGMPDSNYFCRMFKRVHGCSPTDYRNRR